METHIGRSMILSLYPVGMMATVFIWDTFLEHIHPMFLLILVIEYFYRLFNKL